MNVVTATKSNNTITVLVNDNGVVKPIPATSEHPKWNELLKAWTEQNFDAMLELLSVKRIIERFSNGDLVVSDNGVFYKDMPLAGIDVDRILAFLRQNEPYQPIANYMVRKLQNPSRRAITEMYNFLEHKNMPLTPTGTIIAYKGVRKDFFSVCSGKEVLIHGRRNEDGQIFYGVGEVIEMNRSDVDDDFRVGCSAGIHAGSLSYAKDWARTNDGIIILIEIDPVDVVSIPEDCNCTKMRCCKCKVLGTYDGPLPDTYTADYCDPECPVCDDSHDEDDRREEEICDECGEYEDYCVCDQETPEDDDVTGNPACDALGHTNGPAATPDNTLRIRFVSALCGLIGGSPNEVTDDKRFIDDLGFDSLDQIEFVMALEEEFGTEITDEDAEKCETVGQGLALIQKLVAKDSVPLDTIPIQTAGQIATVANTYQRGYDLGVRDGVRRRKRKYYETDITVEDEKQFMAGYCDGYRAGRKDYKH